MLEWTQGGHSVARHKDRGLRRGQGYVERRVDAQERVLFVARWPEGDRYPSKTFRVADGEHEADIRDRAEQHVREMTSAARRRSGRYITPADLTVLDVVNQYLVRGESRWAPNTYATYCQKTRGCIERQIGKVRIRDLDTARVQHWIDELHRAGWQPPTIANAHIILNSACKEAVRLGILTANPATGVRLPKAKRTQHTTWTREQVGQVLAEVAAEPMWHALYRLALMTGMRPGEIRALKWSDLDLERATVTVRRTMTKDRNGRPTLGQDTKTAHPRQIALPATVVAALRVWSTEQKRVRLRTEGWVDTGAVFTGVRGVHLSLSGWQRNHVRFCEAAGVPVVTLHELRHTAATVMLSNGIPVKVVSDILGHSRIETTLNIYQHVSADLQRSATDALESLLNTTTLTRNRPESEAESG